MTSEELIACIAERYSTEPEYPWGDENFIFRHLNNRKWFATGMRPPARVLGIAGEEAVEIVNVKCDPRLAGAYRALPGVLPAYHMNKEHWLTLVLQSAGDSIQSAGDETIKELLELSFDLTAGKGRRRR